jgi:hypothetical protein
MQALVAIIEATLAASTSMFAPTGSPAPYPPAEGSPAAVSTSERAFPDYFVGTWNGTVTHVGPGASTYSVTITLHKGNPGEYVGTSNYPLGCSGVLNLIAAGESQVTVRESLRSGFDKCADNTTITLSRANGGLNYRYDAEGASGTGYLTHS